jgi:hemolysin activation/secretion protein
MLGVRNQKGHVFVRACASASRVRLLVGAMACALLASAAPAWGQAVPSAADAARVQQRMPDATLPQPEVKAGAAARALPVVAVPKKAKTIRFTLKAVQIDGATAFDEAALADIYRDSIGQEIALDVVWEFAAAITERYQQAGYFLSRAYVPAQEIDEGIVHIRVAEGYVHDVQLDAQATTNPLVVAWTERLRSERPLRLASMESLLLRLNDLAGQDYRAVLEKAIDPDAPEGAALLNVVTVEEHKEFRVGFDNFGSRYLGPYEANAQVVLPIIPNQKTTVSWLGSLPMDELKYGSITHSIPLSYDWAMDLNASRTDTHPGSILESQEIDSVSTGFGFGFSYQWKRQRNENILTRLSFDGRNTRSDLLKILPITRDQVRALRATTTYQRAHDAGDYDYASLTVSQGIDGFGASKAGDANLSRAEAKPDFSKIEAMYSHLQPLPQNFVGVVSLNGQFASGPLYSSEEFGYGGQSFGRAYDASEITGDHGVAAALELRYNGLKPWGGMHFAPYGFYDIGRVWNDDAGQEKQASGSSMGVGVRAATELGITANIGVAIPLTRDVDQPIYGNGKSPRYMLQLTYEY